MRIFKYDQFISEALRPSQWRPYLMQFNRDRYKDLFDKYKAIYSGDKNSYRLYIPLEKEVSQTENDIKDLFSKYDYEVVDYISGKAKFAGAKNLSKIGQVLQKIERQNPDQSEISKSLQKKFIEDPIRKAGQDLLICVSRHPYDIAGSDTDRNWRNCLTIGDLFGKRYQRHMSEIKQEVDKVNLKDLADEIDEMIEDRDLFEIEREPIDLEQSLTWDDNTIINLMDELKKFNINIDEDDLFMFEDGDGLLETEDLEFNELAGKYNSIMSKIKSIWEYVIDGGNTHHILNHVKNGVLMSYLIRSNDKDIKNPVANLDIKPYYNVENKSEYVLVSDKKMYGHASPEYKKTLDNWLRDVNHGKVGKFQLGEDIYADFQSKTIEIDENGNITELEELTD